MESNVIASKHTSKSKSLSTDGVAGDVVVEQARRAMTPVTQSISVREPGQCHMLAVTRCGWGVIPTTYGEFHQMTFRVNDRWHEYHCLIKAERWTGDFQPQFRWPDKLPLRVDSACVGGMIFGATDCDCRAQLLEAEEEIARNGEGLIVHISGQDGRGKGTGFKCATQILQKELGYDTVLAARTLAEGTDIDVRTFGGAVAVLKFLLGTRQNVELVLISGNPQKVDALRRNGFRVTIKPSEVPSTPETIRHLRAKALHLAHVIPSITF